MKQSSELDNQASIQQPALFTTCSQIRAESRLLFYRRHAFKLHVWHEEQSFWTKLAKRLHLSEHRTSQERVTGWLDAIGEQARRQIRRVEMEIECGKDARLTAEYYAPFIDELHARLPDEATVVYRALGSERRQLKLLWELGKIFHGRDARRTPLLEYHRFSMDMQGATLWVSTWIQHEIDLEGLYARPSLKFGPGQGWFGGVPWWSYWARKWY